MSLRLDPSAGPGDMDIAWMRLSDAQGTTIREWKPQTAKRLK